MNQPQLPPETLVGFAPFSYQYGGHEEKGTVNKGGT